MARLVTCGWESGAGGEGTIGATVGITPDTTIVRTGTYSGKVAAANTLTTALRSAQTAASTDTWYGRAYIYVASTPTAAATIFECTQALNGTGTGIGVRLNTDLTLSLMIAATAQTPVSSALSTGTWYRLELRGTLGSSGTAQGELVVNGTSVVSTTGSTTTTTFEFIRLSTGTALGADLYYDDVAINDQTGASQNTFPGTGSVRMLLPVVDSAVGTGWTTSGGASTGLWDNVNNTPPTGIADTTASAGHQIRNATSNANSAYDAQVVDYQTGGIASYDTINVVQAVVNTGAPVSTSAKAGTVGCISNPAGTMGNLNNQGTAGTFWQGNAASTFPTGWKWNYSPSVAGDVVAANRGTQPVIRINQVTSSTRIALVDFLGLCVDYTPGTPSTLLWKPSRGPNYRR